MRKKLGDSDPPNVGTIARGGTCSVTEMKKWNSAHLECGRSISDALKWDICGMDPGEGTPTFHVGQKPDQTSHPL